MDVSAPTAEKLFGQLVKPIVMYGSEIWGLPKYILSMPKVTVDSH